MAEKDSLMEYREKRDFSVTSEPSGDEGVSIGEPIFVIQKHAATRLHYDFRLEVNGVLKSWAIPKGPSTDPGEKRLAVPTEDHPLGYADFEGTIPEGSYGAGTVLVWDRGTYRNLTEKDGRTIPVGEGIEGGHLSIWLKGERLRGRYALTRFKTGKDEAWLLVKKDDEEADLHSRPVLTEQKSVISGRTLEEIAGGGRE